MRQGETVHADDTPVPVLDPGRGKTKTGRLWVAVRDERPWGSGVPPAVFYRYSPDRKSEFLAQRRKKVQSRYQATKAAIRPTGITMSSRTLVQGGKAPGPAEEGTAALRHPSPSLFLMHLLTLKRCCNPLAIRVKI